MLSCEHKVLISIQETNLWAQNANLRKQCIYFSCVQGSIHSKLKLFKIWKKKLKCDFKEILKEYFFRCFFIFTISIFIFLKNALLGLKLFLILFFFKFTILFFPFTLSWSKFDLIVQRQKRRTSSTFNLSKLQAIRY